MPSGRRHRVVKRALVAAVTIGLLAGGCAPLVQPAGPPVVSPALQDDRFVAADGAELPVRRWLPDGPPRAVVLALHGFNDYGNFFAAPGAYLATQGIATYAYDQRGFGAAPHPGIWAGTAALAGDLMAVAAEVKERHRDVPLILLGESMGGAVVMVAVTGPRPPPADAVILAAPAVWGRATMPWYQRAALWVAVRTVPWLRLTGRGLGRVPSDNVDMLRALARDPLVIKETRVDAVHGLVGLMDAALAAAPKVPLPALILYGDRDEIIPSEPVDRMLCRLAETGPEDGVRVARYATGYHMLLRDLEAETVWRDIAAWIVDPAAALPSGVGATVEAVRGDACPA